MLATAAEIDTQELDPQQLDKLAAKAARKQIGHFAWVTVFFSASLVATFSALAYGVYAGVIPALLAALILGPLGYAIYIPMHEAAHRMISGSNPKFDFVNVIIGVVHGNIMGLPYFIHRAEHLVHHGRTNRPGEDPDFDAIDGTNIFASAPKAFYNNYENYFSKHWSKAPFDERCYVVLEIIAIVATRVAFAMATSVGTMLVFMGFGAYCLYVVTVAVLATSVHPEPSQVGRYVDTRNYSVENLPRWKAMLINSLWLGHNYHGIHHLFPTVPFYRMATVFREIEPIIRARGGEVIDLSEERVPWVRQGMRL